jgi:predicted Zn-dependent protease
VCLFLCFATFGLPAPRPVQGELTGEGLNDYSNLTIEIVRTGAALPERATVDPNGRFEFRNVPEGYYLFRITDFHGTTVHEHYGTASATESLTIRLPTSKVARPPSGSISVQELQHRKVKAAVKTFNKSVHRKEAGDIHGALALLEQSVSLDPHYVPALNNLGATYIRIGRFTDAVSTFERAVAASPSNAILHANLAHALLCTGDYGRAEAAARQAQQIDGSSARAAYYLGLSLLSQKKFTAETVGWLRKGRAVDARAELALGAALAQTGAYHEARKVLQQCQSSAHPVVSAEARLLLSRLQ